MYVICICISILQELSMHLIVHPATHPGLSHSTAFCFVFPCHADLKVKADDRTVQCTPAPGFFRAWQFYTPC